MSEESALVNPQALEDLANAEALPEAQLGVNEYYLNTIGILEREVAKLKAENADLDAALREARGT